MLINRVRLSGRHVSSRRLGRVALAVVVLLTSAGNPSSRLSAAEAENIAAVEKRIADAARYLSSDELEGRGIGTAGLNLAAEYVAAELAELGLKTTIYDGKPFQRFSVTTTSKMGPKEHNRLTLAGPPPAKGKPPRRIELTLGKDFNPLALGGSGKFDLPVVFVGYGITDKEKKYDDYAGVDVDGKAVVILRHEPQRGNPHRLFQPLSGRDYSFHAPYSRKLSNAYEHGAAAVIFATGRFEIDRQLKSYHQRWQRAVDDLAEENAKFRKLEIPTPEQAEKHRQTIDRLAADITRYSQQIDQRQDPLVGFSDASTGSGGRSFPVFHAGRTALDQMIRPALGSDLAAVEKEIDDGPKPRSRELEGWKIVGETVVERTESPVKNIVAVLEGEGPLADETVIIGAHYDHLGRGGRGSAARGSKEIHNGADDNGSGTAVLLEVARQLAGRREKLRRRIVLIAFTGEETGLLGSAHYVGDPLYPLDKTVAMLNMDMVGRLKDDKLAIHGTGTAKGFNAMIDEVNKSHDFKITRNPGGFGPSDHASFYGRKIPVLHFFTGTHTDYHRPTDDFEKLNVPGMRRVGEMVTECAVRLANAPQRPEYVSVQSTRRGRPTGSRPYFGSIPSFTSDSPGYAIQAAAKGSPAERAGIKGGDSIVKFGDSKIANLEDFDSALRKYKAGDKVPVVVLREGKEVTVTVTLDPPR